MEIVIIGGIAAGMGAAAKAARENPKANITVIEKEDYILFLENLIIFAKNNIILINFLDEILEDINSIKSNNVNSKFIVDKWILKI